MSAPLGSYTGGSGATTCVMPATSTCESFVLNLQGQHSPQEGKAVMARFLPTSKCLSQVKLINILYGAIVCPLHLAILQEP